MPKKETTIANSDISSVFQYTFYNNKDMPSDERLDIPNLGHCPASHSAESRSLRPVNILTTL